MMTRDVIHTDRAPQAIGPYSQAIRSGDLLYTSGQIPLEPATGELVAGGIEAQAERTLDNLEAVLAAAGAGWCDVLQAQIYLVDLGDFAVVNAIYGRRFEGIEPPARVTIGVAALPKGSRIEIAAVARVSVGG
jgi:2-iminobutanoate/2-iminopropanoate deaminase